MSKTCLVCTAPHLEMISILRHPGGLDSMLRFLLGLQANANDYLCKKCCSEVIDAFESKQKFHKFNQLGPEVLGSDWAVVKDEIDPGNQIKNVVSAKDSVVKIEPQSDNLEALKVNDESTHIRCDEMLKPDFDLKLEPKLELSTDNEYNLVSQSSIWATVGGEPDSVKLKRTGSFSSVPQEDFNIVTSDAACKQIGSLSSENCLEYFKREKSVDIEDSTDEQLSDGRESIEEIIKTIDSLESKDVAVTDQQQKPIICCEICNKSYRQILRFQNHFKREHPDITIKNPSLLENPYKCSYCSKTFKDSYRQQAHVRTHTKEKPYACSECGLGFITSYKLKIHQRIHTGERPYKCSHCPKSFVTSDARLLHVRTHMNEKPYVCSECGKSFITRNLLKIHERVHTGERPHKCSYCSKTFACSSVHKRHERRHTNEESHVCSECGKTFNTSYILKVHQRIHTGEKPYQCSYCSKTFTVGCDLRKHERTHSKEKPYVCSDCGNSFNTSYTLKVHQRIHTGEKPYKCTYCSKTFTNSTSHKNHVRVHTNEKPYVCSECGKSYITSCRLKIHQRIHTGEKPYELLLL